MKHTQPIILVLENETGIARDIALFGWAINKEKSVIEIANNSDIKIESPGDLTYKHIMMDLVTRQRLTIGEIYAVIDDEDYMEQGTLKIVTRDAFGNSVSHQMLICDYFSLFQQQQNIVVIDKGFRLDATVEVIISNLKKKCQVYFYPKFEGSLEEREKNIQFDNNPNPYPEQDVKKGNSNWVILKNTTDQPQTVKFLLAESEPGDPYYFVKLDNENISIVDSMPSYIKENDQLFAMFKDQAVLHKVYSKNPQQVAENFTVYPGKKSERLISSLSPYQTRSDLKRVDINLLAYIDGKDIDEAFAEITILPSSNLVLFFTSVSIYQ